MAPLAQKLESEVAVVEQKVQEVAKAVEVKAQAVVQDVENVHPGVIWSNFEEFFRQYAKEHGVNQNWVKVVKQHVKDLGALKDQSKWLQSVKHFGI